MRAHDVLMGDIAVVRECAQKCAHFESNSFYLSIFIKNLALYSFEIFYF